MKIPFLHFLITLLCVVVTLPVGARDCQVPVGVAANSKDKDISPEIEIQLQKRIESLMGAQNLSSAFPDTQFLIVAELAEVQTDELPGPPRQTIVQATLILHLCDTQTGDMLESLRLEGLKGVGNSIQRAVLNSLRPINGSNKKLTTFLDSASDKIIAYYDSQYPYILTQAENLASRREFGEALYFLATIPQCCKGYNVAGSTACLIYQRMIDSDGWEALNTAAAIWAVSPDKAGAMAALPILMTIPSNSAASDEANMLLTEISKEMKDDKEFETRTKYKDDVHLQELQIEAAREVGAAWGKGQKSSTHNLNVIR